MDYLLHHLFLSSLAKNPEKVSVADREVTLTYQELSQAVGYLMEGICKAGIQRGDRVAFFLDHNVKQACAILAISAAGGVFVPINDTLFPEQVRHILRDSGARMLVTTSNRKMAISSILAECQALENVWAIDLTVSTKSLERTDYCVENDLAAILYTSGSTGSPKGVMLSHKNLISGCQIVSSYLKLTEKDRLLGVLPLSFDYGLNQLITMLANGGTYRFLSFRLPNDIVRALSEHQITGFAGVPPIWALLARSSLGRTPLPNLRYITNSGGAMPTRVLEILRKTLPNTEIFLMYGLTEAFRSTYLPPSELDQRPTSIGKAIPNNEILVVSEAGTLCESGEIGELVHRGSTVSMGYWMRPDATSEVFKPYNLSGNNGCIPEFVVHSGDLVKRDEEGFLYFVGRRDAMIKVSGYRISPTEIEEVVFKSGLVKEAAAIGIPDEMAGQVIKVFAVPIDDIDNADQFSLTLIEFCAKHFPIYMIPRYVETTNTIPKTPTGKIDYPSLRTRSNP